MAKKIFNTISALYIFVYSIMLGHYSYLMFNHNYISFTQNSQLLFCVISIIVPILFFLASFMIITRLFNKNVSSFAISLLLVIGYGLYVLSSHYYGFFKPPEYVFANNLILTCLNKNLMGIILSILIITIYYPLKNINTNIGSKSATIIYFLVSSYWVTCFCFSLTKIDLNKENALLYVSIIIMAILICATGILAIVFVFKKHTIKYFYNVLICFIINSLIISYAYNNYILDIPEKIFVRLIDLSPYLASTSVSAFYIFAFIIFEFALIAKPSRNRTELI